jgi:two-component system, LytTR family, response regulator
MKILLHTLKGARIVETENIIYCEANGNFTKIYLSKNEKNSTNDSFISTKLLKDLEEILSKGDFYRCHRSFLINLKYFIEFDTSKNSIILENGIEIKIAKNKKTESKKRLLSYIEKYNSFKKQYP